MTPEQQERIRLNRERALAKRKAAQERQAQQNNTQTGKGITFTVSNVCRQANAVKIWCKSPVLNLQLRTAEKSAWNTYPKTADGRNANNLCLNFSMQPLLEAPSTFNVELFVAKDYLCGICWGAQY